MKRIVSNLMMLLSMTMVLAFIMPTMTNAQGGKTNFAGNWVLNESKTVMNRNQINPARTVLEQMYA